MRAGEPVTLNFANAEIEAVARTMATITGRNVVVDPRVKGQLNLVTERAVSPAAAFQQFLAGTGSMLTWWGDVGSMARTSDTSVVGDVVGFSINPGAEKVYNSKTGQWDKLPSGPNFASDGASICTAPSVSASSSSLSL